MTQVFVQPGGPSSPQTKGGRALRSIFPEIMSLSRYLKQVPLSGGLPISEFWELRTASHF